MGYNVLAIVELHISVLELDSPAMGRCLGAFKGSEAEEKTNLDEVGYAVGK